MVALAAWQPSNGGGVCSLGGARTALRMCAEQWVAPQPPAALTRAAAEICRRRFRAGDWWVWLYRDGSGQPSSWERYSVRGSDGDELVLDMSSKFEDAAPYHTHHRMHLSVADNLGARDSAKQWQLREFAFANQKGDWCEAPHRDNVQAFEEKFNVFMMRQALPLPVAITQQRVRDVAGIGSRISLVQSRRHEHTDAWYVREPSYYAGLAAFKAFGVEGSKDSFTFELVALGSAMDTSDMATLSTDAAGRSGFD